jgi:hypothetical protein
LDEPLLRRQAAMPFLLQQPLSGDERAELNRVCPSMARRLDIGLVTTRRR